MGYRQRRRYFVDSPVQGAMLLQAALYWLYGSLIYMAVVFIYRVAPVWFSGQQVDLSEFCFHLAPVVVSSAILFPIVMFRAVRLSHRFVGPMVRFRQILRLLADGKRAPQFALRENDFWCEVAEEINKVSAKFDELITQDSAASTADVETPTNEEPVEVG